MSEKNELAIKIDFSTTQTAIKFNYDELKQQITEKLALYEGKKLTEDNKGELKNIITLLNNTSKLLNRHRIDTANALLELYNIKKFEKDIKEIDALVVAAKLKLDTQVKDHENAVKLEKENDARKYFNHRLEKHNIDFVKFEDLKLNITLGLTDNQAMAAIDSFINKIVDDLGIIELNPNATRILVKYRKSLNLLEATKEVDYEVKAELELAPQPDIVIEFAPKKPFEDIDAVIHNDNDSYFIKAVLNKEQLKNLEEYLTKNSLMFEIEKN